jgi:hypothetical protein
MQLLGGWPGCEYRVDLVSNVWPTVMLLYVLSQYSCKLEAQRRAKHFWLNKLDQAQEEQFVSRHSYCCP